MINTERSIIKALAYFNIFNYPLRKEEIYQWLDPGYDKSYIDKILDALCDEGIVYRIDEFYSLQDDPDLAERRRAGNRKAAGQLRIARKIARFLYRFPFVRGIAISGSLSKNYADANSDIDFFIITSANRLWLARTCMHFFKKITFLTGRQHWYCMNYYVDEQAFEIREKNIFTAVEVMTLLPVYGRGKFNEFFLANKWAGQFLPACQPRLNAAEELRKGYLHSLAEKIFDSGFGDRLNILLMHITLKRWKKKALLQQRSYSGERMGLDGGMHYAKPDPVNFQRKILYRFEKEMEAWMMRLDHEKSA